MIKKRTLVYIIYNFVSAIIFMLALPITRSYFFQQRWLFLFFGAIALLLLYGLSGSFNQITRQSRYKEFVGTVNQSIVISLLYLGYIYLFENSNLNAGHVSAAFHLFSYHLAIMVSFRLCYLSGIKRLLQNRRIGFKTLLIGNPKKMTAIYQEINNQKKSLGFDFAGYICLDKKAVNLALKNMGEIDDMAAVIRANEIEEVILAIDAPNHEKLKPILDELEQTEAIVHIIPGMCDVVSGFVKIDYLFAIPLITLNAEAMPFWQRVFKRIFDYLVSLTVLVLLSPLMLLIALVIKASSEGPIFYGQERIGKKGKPFHIYKFRTMYNNAEKNGPQLSSKGDPRITKVGLWLRKLRLDELPQFINVLKGEMSIVGPRPERSYFIAQLKTKAPHYNYLHKVLPGITSWGQVKFGYAENVDQMVERLTFDIIYIENRSLALDFKIMIYTFVIIFQGRGK